MFFYNEYSPDIIAMLWRPSAFVPENFSAVASEFKHPVLSPWKEDTFVIPNMDDLLHEICYISKDIITHAKILDDKQTKSREDPVVKRHKSTRQEEETHMNNE